MGNQASKGLKRCIVSGQTEQLRKALEEENSSENLNITLNRKGDTALILAVRLGQYNLVPLLLTKGCHVNVVNCEQQTALDVCLTKELPSDEDILHHHFCPYSNCEGDEFVLCDVLRLLLEAGGTGNSLQRLILHTMKNTVTIKQIIQSICGLDRPDMFRISGLLLQVVVWFEQSENLLHLLRRGINILDFWKAQFVPLFVPNTHHPRAANLSRSVDGAEYTLPTIPETNALQSLKFSFVQDWRADWNDGENPSAQFRAGLHLTPTSAIALTKAANSYSVLVRVMRDVLSYLPPICDGPNLRDSNLIAYLAIAGYVFNREEKQHLHLKFGVDFKHFDSFIKEPKTLKHLSRVAVRFSIRTNVVHGVKVIGCLPPVLNCYLTLDDGGVEVNCSHLS